MDSMFLIANGEQAEIADGAARLMAARMPLARCAGAKYARSDAFAEIWNTCAESGWFAIASPESEGGVGASPVEDMLVQRELGRVLAPLAMLATPLAAHLARGAGAYALARDLRRGTVKAGFAVWQGENLLLLDGDIAEIALSCVGATLELRALAPSAKRTPSVCLDATLPAVLIKRSDRRVETVASQTGGELLLHARTMIAAHFTAIAESACAMAVVYAKVREQFGRPIGAFQAIKHRCADMVLRSEAAFAQTCAASAALRQAPARAPLEAAAAYHVARKAAIMNARDNAQIHGAIGMTEDHLAHLLIKRFHILDALGLGAGLSKTLLEV